jgi:hypothetical protein
MAAGDMDTRSSDWMAGHMTAFQKATGYAFWGDARKTVFDLVQAIGSGYSSKTGLMPDFVVGRSQPEMTRESPSPGFIRRAGAAARSVDGRGIRVRSPALRATP